MKSLAAIQAQGANLAQELQQIQTDIRTDRRALEAAAGDTKQAERAGVIASRLLVLEARARSLQDAIATNGQEQQARRDVIASKEYKQAQKRAAELEKQVDAEAAEIKKAIAALFDRTQAALQAHGELCRLIDADTELEDIEKSARTRGPAWKYIVDVNMILMQRRAVDQRLEAWEKETAARLAAKRTPKPATIAQTVANVVNRYRYTNHDGTPSLDANGKPIG
jgi:chromosome segregation ATPase